MVHFTGMVPSHSGAANGLHRAQGPTALLNADTFVTWILAGTAPKVAGTGAPTSGQQFATVTSMVAGVPAAPPTLVYVPEGLFGSTLAKLPCHTVAPQAVSRNIRLQVPNPSKNIVVKHWLSCQLPAG